MVSATLPGERQLRWLHKIHLTCQAAMLRFGVNSNIEFPTTAVVGLIVWLPASGHLFASRFHRMARRRSLHPKTPKPTSGAAEQRLLYECPAGCRDLITGKLITTYAGMLC